MIDIVAPQQAASSPTAPAPAKKAVAKKPKNPRAEPSHPPTSEMLNSAIKSVNERDVAANYKVDTEKMAPFIKKYLKAAVASGALVQTKGKGGSGSFKLSASGKKISESAVTVAPKTASRKAPKAMSPKRAVATGVAAATALTKTKKPATNRKTADAAKAKKPAVKKKAAAAAAKPKSPSKALSATMGPTQKPKAPKQKTAKTTGAVPKATPKKATSPKKK